MTPDQIAGSSPRKPKRWPVALLVGAITAIASAALTIPVADWAMELLNVSNREGGRGFAIILVWVPLALLIGFVVGFVVSFPVKRSGVAGYAIRQGISLGIMAALILGLGGLVYATADHPPLLGGKNLALEIETRVPADGRTVDDLQKGNFDVALVVSASDRSYSDMRWNKAIAAGDFITVPAWANLNSSNASREITAGLAKESRQVFNVILPAAPKKIDEAWSEWSPPRERFDRSKPAPSEQYSVRYRVRFAEEYSPTPRPVTPEERDSSNSETSPSPDESATPIPEP